MRKNFTFRKKKKRKEREKERETKRISQICILQIRTRARSGNLHREKWRKPLFRVIILDRQRHLPTTFSHTRNFSRQDPILNTSENHVEQILDLHPSGTIILCISTKYLRLIPCILQVSQRDFAAISYAACKCAK